MKKQTEAIDKKQLSYYKKQKLITKATKDEITSASSKTVNRLEPTILRLGQDGWLLDFFTEHIFKQLMRDFHLESEEDGAMIKESPESLFNFLIEMIEKGILPYPMISIDLKTAKQFLQKPFSEKQLFGVVERLGELVLKGGFTLPKIINIDTNQSFEWTLKKNETIFSYAFLKKEKLGEKPRGRRTTDHYKYYMTLTFLGIYLILATCAFYNIEFLPKALYRLNAGCNDFYRSIAGFWSYPGFVKLSYEGVRRRMGIQEQGNASNERSYVERNLNYLKKEGIIDDWKRTVKAGNEQYIRNENIVYDITLNEKNRKRSRNFWRRKAREKMALEQLREHQKNEKEEAEK